jgi:hypothetical protein
MKPITVMTVFGTRPEAIKMCPLVQELDRRPEFDCRCCVTAQHREMLDSVLEIFGRKPDFDLDIMQPRQTLSTITSKTILGMDDVLAEVKPDLILVHGDTSTTFAGALAAFYHKVPVGHVEAGLRTWDKYSPFGLIGADSVIIKAGKDVNPVKISSLSYALNRKGDTWTDSLKCKGLSVPDLFKGMEDTVKRYAPEGLKLDITSKSTSDNKSVQSESSYLVPGLGKLVTVTSFEGEFGELRKHCLSVDMDKLDPFALVSGLKVQKLKLSYADSGLLPLILSGIAANVGMPPAVLAQEASTVAFGMATDGNVALRKLGTALGQQLLSPGELELEFAPEKAMDLDEFTGRLLTDPKSLPLTVTSKPGKKSMQEYFLDN